MKINLVYGLAHLHMLGYRTFDTSLIFKVLEWFKEVMHPCYLILDREGIDSLEKLETEIDSIYEKAMRELLTIDKIDNNYYLKMQKMFYIIKTSIKYWNQSLKHGVNDVYSLSDLFMVFNFDLTKSNKIQMLSKLIKLYHKLININCMTKHNRIIDLEKTAVKNKINFSETVDLNTSLLCFLNMQKLKDEIYVHQIDVPETFKIVGEIADYYLDLYKAELKIKHIEVADFLDIRESEIKQKFGNLIDPKTYNYTILPKNDNKKFLNVIKMIPVVNSGSLSINNFWLDQDRLIDTFNFSSITAIKSEDIYWNEKILKSKNIEEVMVRDYNSKVKLLAGAKNKNSICSPLYDIQYLIDSIGGMKTYSKAQERKQKTNLETSSMDTCYNDVDFIKIASFVTLEELEKKCDYNLRKLNVENIMSELIDKVPKVANQNIETYVVMKKDSEQYSNPFLKNYYSSELETQMENITIDRVDVDAGLFGVSVEEIQNPNFPKEAMEVVFLKSGKRTLDLLGKTIMTFFENVKNPNGIILVEGSNGSGLQFTRINVNDVKNVIDNYKKTYEPIKSEMAKIILKENIFQKVNMSLERIENLIVVHEMLISIFIHCYDQFREMYQKNKMDLPLYINYLAALCNILVFHFERIYSFMEHTNSTHLSRTWYTLYSSILISIYSMTTLVNRKNADLKNMRTRKLDVIKNEIDTYCSTRPNYDKEMRDSIKNQVAINSEYSYNLSTEDALIEKSARTRQSLKKQKNPVDTPPASISILDTPIDLNPVMPAPIIPTTILPLTIDLDNLNIRESMNPNRYQPKPITLEVLTIDASDKTTIKAANTYYGMHKTKLDAMFKNLLTETKDSMVLEIVDNITTCQKIQRSFKDTHITELSKYYDYLCPDYMFTEINMLEHKLQEVKDTTTMEYKKMATELHECRINTVRTLVAILPIWKKLDKLISAESLASFNLEQILYSLQDHRTDIFMRSVEKIYNISALDMTTRLFTRHGATTDTPIEMITIKKLRIVNNDSKKVTNTLKKVIKEFDIDVIEDCINKIFNMYDKLRKSTKSCVDLILNSITATPEMSSLFNYMKYLKDNPETIMMTPMYNSNLRILTEIDNIRRTSPVVIERPFCTEINYYEYTKFYSQENLDKVNRAKVLKPLLDPYRITEIPNTEFLEIVKNLNPQTKLDSIHYDVLLVLPKPRSRSKKDLTKKDSNAPASILDAPITGFVNEPVIVPSVAPITTPILPPVRAVTPIVTPVARPNPAPQSRPVTPQNRPKSPEPVTAPELPKLLPQSLPQPVAQPNTGPQQDTGDVIKKAVKNEFDKILIVKDSSNSELFRFHFNSETNFEFRNSRFIPKKKTGFRRIASKKLNKDVIDAIYEGNTALCAPYLINSEHNFQFLKITNRDLKFSLTNVYSNLYNITEAFFKSEELFGKSNFGAESLQLFSNAMNAKINSLLSNDRMVDKLMTEMNGNGRELQKSFVNFLDYSKRVKLDEKVNKEFVSNIESSLGILKTKLEALTKIKSDYAVISGLTLEEMKKNFAHPFVLENNVSKMKEFSSYFSELETTIEKMGSLFDHVFIPYQLIDKKISEILNRYEVLLQIIKTNHIGKYIKNAMESIKETQKQTINQLIKKKFDQNDSKLKAQFGSLNNKLKNVKHMASSSVFFYYIVSSGMHEIDSTYQDFADFEQSFINSTKKLVNEYDSVIKAFAAASTKNRKRFTDVNPRIPLMDLVKFNFYETITAINVAIITKDPNDDSGVSIKDYIKKLIYFYVTTLCKISSETQSYYNTTLSKILEENAKDLGHQNKIFNSEIDFKYKTLNKYQDDYLQINSIKFDLSPIQKSKMISLVSSFGFIDSESSEVKELVEVSNSYIDIMDLRFNTENRSLSHFKVPYKMEVNSNLSETDIVHVFKNRF
ncbi:hypothetical protein [Carp edema virus]|nr:hypothetical protein [Carp edema virus]